MDSIKYLDHKVNKNLLIIIKLFNIPNSFPLIKRLHDFVPVTNEKFIFYSFSDMYSNILIRLNNIILMVLQYTQQT